MTAPSPKSAASLLFAALMCASNAGVQAGNPFMDRIATARTPAETALATKWGCPSVMVHSIAAAPFKFIGQHVCLQGYVGPQYAETEFNYFDAWPIGSDYTDQPPIVVIGDARNLSTGQYVEVYGTVVKPKNGRTETGEALFAVVKAVIVDEDLLGMGQRKSGDGKPSSSLGAPAPK